MNGERFHDALDLLDDELIEAVEKIRQHKKYRPLRSWAAMAACLCVLLIGVTVWGHIKNYDSVPDDGVTEGVGNTNTQEDYDGASPEDCVLDGDDENITESVNDGSTESQLASMLVRITSWNEDGFDGVVTEVTAGEFVALRQHITVIFISEVNVKCGADGFKYDPENPNAADCGIATGEVVKVYYSFRHENTTAVAYIIEAPNE